jgi:hypothetical protein
MIRFAKKMTLAVLMIAVSLAAFPLTNVYAAAGYDPSVPPQDGRLSNERLELIWARQLRAYERLGKLFDANDAAFERVQNLIDKARENGKDVSALQAAFDALQAAIKEARPTYESIKGIVNSHQGFDAGGKVTDAEKAKETVRDMGDKLREVRTTIGAAFKNLREAVRAFREANPPAPSTVK